MFTRSPNRPMQARDSGGQKMKMIIVRLLAPLAFYLLLPVRDVSTDIHRMCTAGCYAPPLTPHRFTVNCNRGVSAPDCFHKIRLSPPKVVAPPPLWDPINTQIAATNFSRLPRSTRVIGRSLN
jgi:hypothetical protein